MKVLIEIQGGSPDDQMQLATDLVDDKHADALCADYQVNALRILEVWS